MQINRLIPYCLSIYDQMVENGDIPDLSKKILQIGDIKSKYPSSVTKTQYNYFSILMSEIVKDKLKHLKNDNKYELDSNKISKNLSKKIKYPCPKLKYDIIDQDINKIFEHMIKTIDYLKNCQNDVTISYKIDYLNLIANPDMIYFHHNDNNEDKKEDEISIYDVVTVGNFKIYREMCLKILCNYAIAKINGFIVRDVGILFTLQKKFVRFDLNKWYSYDKFINTLELRYQMYMAYTKMMHNSEIFGSHIGKHSSLITTFYTNFNANNNKPCQIFLSNPQSGAILHQLDDEDTINASMYIKANNVNFRTHSPYIINLADPNLNNLEIDIKQKTPKINNKIINNKDNNWGMNILIHELQLTDKLGGTGCVFHVGKYKENDKLLATKKMYDSIKKVLPFATQSCPLIIETPAGQKTELLSTFDEFLEFYMSFSDVERSVFKVCIDTCHVFSSGEMPLNYIKKWIESAGKDSISVIHFNDSLDEFSCHVDRHAHLGTGFIGLEEMHSIFELAQSKNISLIVE